MNAQRVCVCVLRNFIDSTTCFFGKRLIHNFPKYVSTRVFVNMPYIRLLFTMCLCRICFKDYTEQIDTLDEYVKLTK